ncbi:MAG: hypothetical protein HFI90_08065 [Clostridia bacterium]|nr:hypothetical protein [Clostridia bacterium]
MKHKLLSLALVFAMLAAALPFSAVTAAGEIIVSETFEEMADIAAGTATDFGGTNATITCALQALKMVTATGGGATDKSMKLSEKLHEIVLKAAPTESYTIEFDMYGEADFTGTGELRFMLMKEIAKRPISINQTTKKFQTNASDIAVDYVPGHWYHAKVEFTMSTAATPLETKWKATITDLATGQTANKSINVSGISAPNKTIQIFPAGATGGPLYIDNFEIYTGTAGGNLSRAAMIPNATSYKVSGVSADETAGTVSVTGGANKAENYLKTGGTATATAQAKDGYAFTGWTAEGITLSAEQQKANPLEIAVESADVTLTANFEQQAVAPKYALTATTGAGGTVSVSPTGTEFEEGAEVRVTAAPSSGYKFTGWTATGVTLTDATANPATFNMPAGAVTLEAAFAAKTDATITPTTATYDVNDAGRRAIEVTLNAGDYTFVALKNGETTLTKDTDYTVDSNKYTIATSYLDTLPAGENTLTFDMDGGADPTLTVTVSDNTPTHTLTATAGEGGKVAVSPEGGSVKEGAEVTVTATPNSGYGFVNWTATGVTLADATAKEITFNMPAGDVTLTANFKALRTASLDKTTATYDQSSPNRKDIEVTLDTGDYTFVQIKKTSAEVLVEGTDYTVDGNKYTIKTSYLDTKEAGKTTTLAFIVAYDGKNDSKSARLAININKTIEQNTFETWKDLEGAPPTAFVSGSANGAYSYSNYSTLQMDKADNGTVQNTSFLLKGTGQPLFMKLTPQGVSGAWTLAYDFYGTFPTAPARLELIHVAGTRAFTIETNGNFAFNGTAVTDDSGAAMTYTPNHWYHVELYMPASGNAIGILTDTTAGKTGTYDYGPNAAARACGYFQIQTAKNIDFYVDNLDFYLGAPDRTRLVTPTIAPGTTPPPAGTHIVTAASTDSAQGTAAVTTEGNGFEAGAIVTVEATPKAGYKFTGWTAAGITLSAQQQKQNPLTITMPDADVTLTAAFAAKTNASVTPAAANYDKYASHADHQAVAVTLAAGDYTFSALKNGSATLAKDTDYTVSGNTYTIATSYLDTLSLGAHTLTFAMDGGTNPAVTVTVANSTPGLQTYSVTAATSDSAQGTAAVQTAGAAFEAGTQVTVAATANKGYQFTSWTAEGITLSAAQQTQNPLTITMPAGDVTLTATFGVDKLAGTMEQNTFETWELPASGKKQDFALSANGNYTWTAKLAKDYAYRGAKENNTLKMKNGALNINLGTVPDYKTGYTVAYDFFGTKEDYSVGDYMAMVQLPEISRRPFQIGKDGIFEANATDIKPALKYTPNHWFHVEVHVGTTGSTTGIASTTVTVTDTTTGETGTLTFNLNGNPYTAKQLRINIAEGFGPLYIDNLDIYEGAPDRTRLVTPNVVPGTQTGLRPDSDYFIDLENEAAGITIKKNLDSADDSALVMSALYDNSTGKPSLMAAKTKQVTLRTGETVSLTAEEIVHKPSGNNYSVRYFIWRMGENGETLDVLAAIDGE